MIFRVCEHYEQHNDIELRECFICYEKNPLSIHLKKQNYYLTDCLCNAVIHEHCLKKWIDLNDKCPICRINVTVKDDTIKNNNIQVILPIIIHFYTIVKICIYFYYVYFIYCNLLFA
jgi:hypothetical protein